MKILFTGGLGFIGSHTAVEVLNAGHDVVIVDAAAIIESGFTEKSDFLIVVHAPVETRKERIIKRDGLSDEEADVRINGQKEDEFYLSKADFIFNNFDPYDVNKQLSQLETELFVWRSIDIMH